MIYLGKIVNQIVEKAKTRPELMGVRTALAANIPQYKIDVDTEKAKAKGMNVSLIEDEGRTVFNGVTTITCVGIGPASRAAIDIITGHLKCY